MTQAQQPKARRITIEPITRLEGEAKIDIFLNDEGNVDNAYFQVVELRSFGFCQGRPVEEMPNKAEADAAISGIRNNLS